MNTTLYPGLIERAHMDHNLNIPVNFSVGDEMDDLCYGSNASTSSSFSSAGPMTPPPTTPSSSRRPSTISTTWSSQYHSESSSVATTDLFSMDSPVSNKLLWNVPGSQDLSFFNDHTSPYGPEDELLTFTSHGLPTTHESVSLPSTGAEGIGISSSPYFPDLFAEASGSSKIFPGNGIDECLARAMFESPTQIPTSHTASWPSLVPDPSPSTIVPSQTITIPVTPRKEAFNVKTTPVKNEFISLPLQSGNEADSPTSSTAAATRAIPRRTKRTEAAVPQIKSESKPRRRNQQQPKRVTTSSGITYPEVSTIEKTPDTNPCLEWIPDPQHPDGGRHCMTIFKRQEHLRRHRLTHQPNAPKYTCVLCGKDLTRRDNLPAHYLTHRPKHGKGRVRGRNYQVGTDELADKLGLIGPKPSKQRAREAVPARKRTAKV